MNTISAGWVHGDHHGKKGAKMLQSIKNPHSFLVTEQKDIP